MSMPTRNPDTGCLTWQGLYGCNSKQRTYSADEGGRDGAVGLQEDAERQGQDEAGDHNPLIPWYRAQPASAGGFKRS